MNNAENLLQELGITEPHEIDLEAIAYYSKVKVKYCPLDGCEATIVGNENKAIITVNSNTKNSERQRFSIGHELGHWFYDRGKGVACKKEALVESEGNTNTKSNVERIEQRANQFASDLLMPSYIFKPLAKKQPITFHTVRDLAEKFQTSLTATAIRLIKLGAFPGMLVCFNRQNSRWNWFVRGPDVPEKFWPNQELDHNTEAFKLLYNSDNKKETPLKQVEADLWIKHRNSEDYFINEHSVKIAEDKVLTLLWWEDESQILDFEEKGYH